MLLLLILGFCLFAFALVGFVAYIAHRNRERISRFMDRRQIHPSMFVGWMQVTAATSMLLCSFMFPMAISVMQVFYVLFAAFFIGVGVDKIRNPPTDEYQPGWLLGEGDQDWRKKIRGRPRRISLQGMLISVTVLAISFAVFGSRLSEKRQAGAAHAAAKARVEEWGGTVEGRTVTLAGTDVTDDDLKVLVDLERIRKLNLGSTGITNRGLETVLQMTSLRSLNLSGTLVDDDGVRLLRGLKDLSRLQLRQTRVTGVCFPVGGPDVDTLIIDLSQCPLTKEGVAAIAQTKNLLHVSLNETEIDDSYLDALMQIQAKSINLSHTNLSKSAVEKLLEREDIHVLHSIRIY